MANPTGQNNNFLSYQKILNGFIWSFGWILLETLVVSSAFATIFKWTDDQGKIHFTDGLDNIPAAQLNKFEISRPDGTFRTGRMTGFSDDAEDSASLKEDSPGEDDSQQPQQKEATLSPEEKSAVEGLIAFLTQEIKRDKVFASYQPNDQTGKTIFNGLKENIGEKQQVVSKLEKVESAVVQGAVAYLKNEIAADENFNILGPRVKNKVSQTISRLKIGISKKESLIESLKKELAENEAKAQAESQTKP